MKLNCVEIQIKMANGQIGTTELAKRSGVPSQTINRVLKAGRATPPTVGKIAAGLGVPVEDILADVHGHA